MPSRHLLPAALAATLLAACSTGTGSGVATSGAPTPAGSGTASASPTPTVEAPLPTEPLARARTLLAQYDYAGASAAIEKVTTPDADDLRARIAAAQASAKPWPHMDAVPHVFFHTLVVDPKRAFTKDAEGVGYSQYMVTVSEFRKQLQQMYDRGYVLVHPQRIAAKDAQGVMRYQQLLLPPGKKPLVLSLDDLSYYEYMTGKGFASRLVVDERGHVVTEYTRPDGTAVRGDDDCVPIVDDFVRTHPDFAYHGDKGSVAMTGYNGVLGYRTSVHSYGDTPTTRAEQAKAKVVADAMKEQGWHFASHSWGHINFTRSSLGRITRDSTRWDAEVKPILGATNELIFPFGADISGMTPYSDANAKFRYLHGTEGFDYIFPIDASKPAWQQLTKDALRQARVNVDGISMQQNLDGRSKTLDTFFDTRSTLDPLRPLPVPMVGGPVPGGAGH